MQTPADSLIASAFALANSRGPALLSALAEFDVWRGDLGAMRGDEPSVPPVVSPARPPTASAQRLHEALKVMEAIQSLDPRCREVLSRFYSQTESETPDPESQACRQRLWRLLASASGSAEGGTLVEDDHVAASHGRSR